MPSHLRIQSTFEAVDAQATYQTSPQLPPAKKQRMSLTQTYYIASTARSKLGKEAGRPDHNLRLLVGHANLLDNLMVELADAEREQEAWFNQSVRKAAKPDEPRRVQWIDTIAETMEEDEEDSEDSDLESEADESELYDIPMPNIRQAPVIIESQEIDFDEEDDEEHALIRVPSRHSTPELASDDSDSEDESMPSSPEQAAFEYNEKEAQVALFETKSQGIDFAIHQSQPMIAAF